MLLLLCRFYRENGRGLCDTGNCCISRDARFPPIAFGFDAHDRRLTGRDDVAGHHVTNRYIAHGMYICAICRPMSYRVIHDAGRTAPGGTVMPGMSTVQPTGGANIAAPSESPRQMFLNSPN